MKNLMVLLFVFLSSYTLNAQTQCMSLSSITFTPGLVPETETSPPLAIFYWDTSYAVYSANTTTKIQIIESDSCDFVEISPIQYYTISDFFSTPVGSITISFDAIGSRCFKWRLVNSGKNSNGVNCSTSTAWQNYNIQNYY